MVSPDWEIDDDERLVVHHRVAVAELVASSTSTGMPAPVLDRVLGDQPGVGRGAAGDHDDLVDPPSTSSSMRSSSSTSRPSASVRPSSVSATACGCSWISFSMKVGVAALLGGGGVPVDVEAPALHRVAVEVGDRPSRSGVMVTTWSWPSSTASRVCPMNAATSEPRKFSPSPSPTTSGELRRAADDDAGRVRVHGEQGEGAVEPARDARASRRAGRPRSAYAAASRCAATSVSVSLVNSTPVAEQLALQRGEVLDDAVVDQREPCRRRRGAGGRSRRSGRRGWPSGCARSPWSPAAAARPRGRPPGRPSLPACLAMTRPAGGLQGDAGRVVPAVLQPPQALHHDVEGLRPPSLRGRRNPRFRT